MGALISQDRTRPVEIDDDRGLSGCARHGPRRRGFVVLELGPVMKGQRTHVDGLLHPPTDRVPIVDQATRILPMDAGDFGIDASELVAQHRLQCRILGIAADQVEIVPIDWEPGAYELRQRDDLVDVAPS